MVCCSFHYHELLKIASVWPKISRLRGKLAANVQIVEVFVILGRLWYSILWMNFKLRNIAC